jgi:sugar phosphate permease
MSLYACGVLGDRFNQRIVLTFGLVGMAVLYVILALIGFYDVTNYAAFYIILSGMGLLNATLLPCMIDINSNWFPKKSRGLLIGLWMSCNNFGNIVGS